jgi:hypothetical protein
MPRDAAERPGSLPYRPHGLHLGALPRMPKPPGTGTNTGAVPGLWSAHAPGQRHESPSAIAHMPALPAAGEHADGARRGSQAAGISGLEKPEDWLDWEPDEDMDPWGLGL